MTLDEFSETTWSAQRILELLATEINNVLRFQASREVTLTLTMGKLESSIFLNLLPRPADIPVAIAMGEQPHPSLNWRTIDQETWVRWFMMMTGDMVSENDAQQLVREIRQRIGEGTSLTFFTNSETGALVLLGLDLMLTVTCTDNTTRH